MSKLAFPLTLPLVARPSKTGEELSAILIFPWIDRLDDWRRYIRIPLKCRVPRISYRVVSRQWTTRMVSSLLNVPRECAMHCCSSTPVFSSSSSCRRPIATRLTSLILSGNCSGLISTSPASASHLGHRSVLVFSFPKSFAPQCYPQQPSIFHGLCGSRSNISFVKLKVDVRQVLG